MCFNPEYFYLKLTKERMNHIEEKIKSLTLEIMANNIDHICQLSGNSLHVGVGSDLDGGYGTEQCPHDLDTIADLQKLPGILEKRGYSKQDVLNIMHLNFVKYLQDYFSAH